MKRVRVARNLLHSEFMQTYYSRYFHKSTLMEIVLYMQSTTMILYTVMDLVRLLHSRKGSFSLLRSN